MDLSSHPDSATRWRRVAPRGRRWRVKGQHRKDTQQLKAWGIRPSFAYVAEPETNGVAERFIRTLKEQVIYGRIYRNLEELRSAIAEFVERYNSRWLVARLAYRSPRQARHEALALAA